MAKEGARKGKLAKRIAMFVVGICRFAWLAAAGWAANGREGKWREAKEGREGGRSEGKVAPVGEEEGRGDDVRAWEGRVWTTRSFAVSWRFCPVTRL